MKKFTVYCQMACLQDIYAQMSQPMTEFLADSSLATWANLYQLLHEHSVLYLDVTPEELLELRKNPIINKLFKNTKYELVKDIIELIGKNDEVVTKTSPQTLFFLDKSPAECKALEEDFGQIFISRTELATQSAWLFAWALRNIPKKDSAYTNWDFLTEFRHPCCALVLADNYILNKPKKWQDNLLKVLVNLLPKKLNKRSFELTIFANVDDRDFEARFKELQEKLPRYDYPIQLTVVRTDDIHDRHLITNYAWLLSGHGFELFERNKVISKGTSITFLPITYLHYDFPKYTTTANNHTISSVKDAVANWLEQYATIKRSGENSDDTAAANSLATKWVLGTRHNHLLHY